MRGLSAIVAVAILAMAGCGGGGGGSGDGGGGDGLTGNWRFAGVARAPAPVAPTAVDGIYVQLGEDRFTYWTDGGCVAHGTFEFSSATTGDGVLLDTNGDQCGWDPGHQFDFIYSTGADSLTIEIDGDAAIFERIEPPSSLAASNYGFMSFTVDGTDYTLVRNNSNAVNRDLEDMIVADENAESFTDGWSENGDSPEIEIRVHFPGQTAGLWTLEDAFQPEINIVPFLNINIDGLEYRANSSDEYLGTSVVVTVTGTGTKLVGTFSGTLINYPEVEGTYNFPTAENQTIVITNGIFEVNLPGD